MGGDCQNINFRFLTFVQVKLRTFLEIGSRRHHGRGDRARAVRTVQQAGPGNGKPAQRGFAAASLSSHQPPPTGRRRMTTDQDAAGYVLQLLTDWKFVLAVVGAVCATIGTLIGILTYRENRKYSALDVEYYTSPVYDYAAEHVEERSFTVKMDNTGTKDLAVTDFHLERRAREGDGVGDPYRRVSLPYAVGRLVNDRALESGESLLLAPGDKGAIEMWYKEKDLAASPGEVWMVIDLTHGGRFRSRSLHLERFQSKVRKGSATFEH